MVIIDTMLIIIVKMHSDIPLDNIIKQNKIPLMTLSGINYSHANLYKDWPSKFSSNAVLLQKF